MPINKKQFKAALVIEILILSIMGLIGFGFWSSICSGSLSSCVSGDELLGVPQFIILSLLRPLFFTPIMIVSMIGGGTFGPIEGTLLTAFGAACSSLLIYLPGHILGQKLVRPWLSANLPATWNLLRTQDYKIIFITRWIPIFPFDLCSLLFGVANFHSRRVFVYTFFGVLPEAYIFATFAGSETTLGRSVFNLLAFAILTALPLVLYEWLFRRKGSGLWTQLKRTYYEVVYEAKINNNIPKTQEFTPGTEPVILLYGFFSSRRALTIMERLLNHRGLSVMSFNLGGSLGVFFTRGIKETAEFIDEKIKRQIERHGFKKVSVVAHSKGGLVAMWWLLKLGGSKYCDRIVTLGTPFKGALITYIALSTPLGFFWRDLWQMRPGSMFLKRLHALKVPENLKIYCCYSSRDRVATDRSGIFEPTSEGSKKNVVAVPMHHVGHFEFLYRRDVGDSLVKILKNTK